MISLEDCLKILKEMNKLLAVVDEIFAFYSMRYIRYNTRYNSSNVVNLFLAERGDMHRRFLLLCFLLPKQMVRDNV